MGKGKRLKAQRKLNQKLKSFLPGDDEPLTEKLILELVQTGWEESQLRFFLKEGGYYYSRSRNSVYEFGAFGGL